MADNKYLDLNGLTHYTNKLQSIIEGLNQRIKTLEAKTLDAYPIGSIYISTNNTEPAELFGGGWEKLENTFLLAAGSDYVVGSKGGEKTHHHTLENGYSKLWVTNDRLNYYKKDTSEFIPSNTTKIVIDSAPTDAVWGLTSTIALGGSTDNSNNMPPYLVVNMWKRVS